MATINSNEGAFLDTLRGWAAIVVLIAHTASWFIQPYFPEVELFIYISASAAVMLFFALSGFFITGSILNNCHKNGGAFDIYNFCVDRLARLYPVLAGAIFITCFAYLAIVTFDLVCSTSCRIDGQLHVEREYARLKPENVFGTLLFLNGVVYGVHTPSMNGPLWSLSHEFWFYMLAALVVVAVTGKTRKACITLLAVALVYCVYFKLYAFLVGLLIWAIGAKARLDREDKPLTIYGPLAVLIAGVFSAYYFFSVESLRAGRYLLGVGLAGLFYIVFANQGLFSRIRVQLLPQTSVCSYTLYAIHWPIIQLAYALWIEGYHSWNVYLKALFVLSLILTIYFVARLLANYLENTSYNRLLLRKILSGVRLNTP